MLDHLYFETLAYFNQEMIMARRCALTGKKRLIGNRVSHANNKTKRKLQVNLQNKRIYDPETGETVRLKICANAIKTLDKIGSLSKFFKKFGKLA